MSAHQEITSYIRLSREKGFSDEAIKTALVNAGWQTKDIHEAFTPTQTNTRFLSPAVIGISILLFLLFGGGAVYGLIWYQTQSGGPFMPTPTSVSTNNIYPTNTPTPTSVQAVVPPVQLSSELSFAHNAFGFSLFQELLKKENNDNIVLSPPSIALALSMTYNGASESTKLSMANTMKVQKIDIKKLNEESALLIKYLSNPDPQVTLVFANSIWSKKGVSFLPEFLTVNKAYYNAEIQTVDFSLPSSADSINAWVNKNTKGKIPTIVEKPIDPSIIMFLINAIYFYGTWTNEFDPTLTQSKPFILLDNTKIQHLLMSQTRSDFLYQETNSFQGIQIPYGKNKQISMTIMLPKISLSSFLKQITHTTWNSWMKSFSEMEGTVSLPKFTVEYKTSLKDSLMSLGMTPAFSSESANFSGIRNHKDLFISDVLHKTFIDVNEKGTEAAAVTSVEMRTTSMSEPKKTFLMNINKPFFFAIADTLSGEILFMGVIKNPAL